MHRILKTVIVAGLVSALSIDEAPAGTLENLERERALTIETILDPALDASEREGKLQLARARLVDLERMVLRDDSLKGRNTPSVRKAFENYDLTFMVHASVEKNRSLSENWMEQIGMTTQSLMAARLGRR